MKKYSTKLWTRKKKIFKIYELVGGMSERYVFLGGLSIVKVCRQGREGVKNVCMYIRLLWTPPFAVLCPLDLDFNLNYVTFWPLTPFFPSDVTLSIFFVNLTLKISRKDLKDYHIDFQNLIQVDTPFGVIHKPRGQNFGFFWPPPSRLCGHFY